MRSLPRSRRETRRLIPASSAQRSIVGGNRCSTSRSATSRDIRSFSPPSPSPSCAMGRSSPSGDRPAQADRDGDRRSHGCAGHRSTDHGRRRAARGVSTCGAPTRRPHPRQRPVDRSKRGAHRRRPRDRRQHLRRRTRSRSRAIVRTSRVVIGPPQYASALPILTQRGGESNRRRLRPRPRSRCCNRRSGSPRGRWTEWYGAPDWARYSLLS